MQRNSMVSDSLESILSDCQSNDKDKQMAAIQEIRNSELHAAIPALVSLLDSKDKEIRRASVIVLGEFDGADPQLIGPALIPMIQDSDDYIQEDAISALEQLKYSPALNSVIYALGLTLNSESVRAAAAAAISHLAENNDASALESLEKALKSDSFYRVRFWAANSIGLLAKPSQTWIKKLTYYYDLEESSDVKIGILSARYRLEDSANLLDKLIELLKEADEDLFRSVLHAFSDMIGDVDVPIKLLEDAPRFSEIISEQIPIFPSEKNHAKGVIRWLKTRLEEQRISSHVSL
jgi:tetratricopeptide (TPR) repeat protein